MPQRARESHAYHRFAGPFSIDGGVYGGQEKCDFYSTLLYQGTCKDCGTTFNDPSYQLVHNPCFAKSGNYHQAEKVKPFGCQYCSSRFPGIPNLRQHIRFHLERRYFCNSCDFKSFTPWEVRNHHQSKHKGSKGRSNGLVHSTLTPLLSKTTKSHRYLNNLPDGAIASSLKANGASSSIEDDFVYRPNMFDDKWEKIHWSGICPTCKNEFDDEIVFHTHDPCYSNSGRLVNGEFKCMFCEKSFGALWNLRMHVQYHVQRRFACKTEGCPYKSFGVSEIRKHVTTHFSIKPFKCTYPGCKKRYSDFQTRKRHYIKHHMNVSNSQVQDQIDIVFCQICNLTFPDGRSYNQHKRDKHNEFFNPRRSQTETRSFPLHRQTINNTSHAASPRPLSQTFVKAPGPASQTLGSSLTNGASPTVISTDTALPKVPLSAETIDQFIYMIPIPNKCKDCEKDFLDPTKYRVHEPCFKYTPYYKKKNAPSNRFVCEFCKKKCEKAAKLRRHMYIHFGKNFVCKICNHHGHNPRVLRDHIMSMHIATQSMQSQKQNTAKKTPENAIPSTSGRMRTNIRSSNNLRPSKGNVASELRSLSTPVSRSVPSSSLSTPLLINERCRDSEGRSLQQSTQNYSRVPCPIGAKLVDSGSFLPPPELISPFIEV